MEEQLVKDFLNTFSNSNTRKTRFYDLKRVEDLLFLNQNDFLDEIIKKDLSVASFKSSLIAYAKFLEFAGDDFEELIEFYRDEKLLYQVQKKPITNDITLEELVAELDTIENTNEKLVLSLYLLYPSLRSDILFVKFRNFDESAEPFYSNGVIYFPVLKKVKRNKVIVINLDNSTIKLIKENITNSNEDNDYIIRMTTDRDNSKRVTEFLQRISYKNFKVRLSINDFRKLHIDKNERNIQKLSRKEQGRSRIELSRKMGHSLLSQQMSYNVSDNV